MRIVSIGEPSTCRHYRSLAPANALRSLGHDAIFVEHAPEHDPERASVTPELLEGADVILAYRMLYDNMPIVRAAVERGAALVWDTDDDLANFPKESASFKALGAKGVRRLTAQRTQAVRLAEVVTTTTERLAGKCAALGARATRVIPNFLPDGIVRQVDRSGRDEVVVGWVAAAEHKIETRHVPIVKALRQLLADDPRVRVESAGIRLPLPEDRYRRYEFVIPDNLPNLLARWDIGIAPLADIPFNRARSDVKLKEYAATGLPWLASPVGPYAGMTEEQGGWLVPDDEWHEALRELADEPETRHALGRFGLRWARSQQITAPDNARRWEAVCAEAVERRAARGAAAAKA